MKSCRLLCLIILSIVFCAYSISSQRNPTTSLPSQWRSQNGDGVFDETGLLKEWPADGPQLLWKYEGLGDGFTSAVISNNKIYVTGLSGDNLMLYVLDLNGRLLTKKELTEEWKQGREGPRSTIRINDGKLYLYTAFGKLFCMDEATLEEVWKKDVLLDFDGQNIPWGLCESPLIVGEKLFISPGGAINNMIALNKNTGELIWSSSGESTVSAYCMPKYIDEQTVPMIVTSMSDYIIAWNSDTGEKLWSFYRTSEFNNHPNTPLYYNNMIFSTTGDGAPAVMLRLKNGGKDVEQVWQNPEVDTQMGGAIRVGDYIYTSGHKNRYWVCLDWNTGEIKYKIRDIAACSVIFADGMLYCYTERGTMNLVKPNPDTFELISSFKITLGDGPHFAHPVIHNGVMYVRHGDALMAYAMK